MTGLDAILLTSLALVSAQERSAAPEKEEAAVQTAKARGLQLRYAPIPWNPDARSAWPLGRLQTSVPLRIDGKTLEPGHYALVCHPGHDHETASLEVVRLQASQWLDPKELRRIPQGDSVYRAPVRFDPAAGTTPHLTITLTPRKGGVTLTARYGNSKIVRDFQR